MAPGFAPGSSDLSHDRFGGIGGAGVIHHYLGAGGCQIKGDGATYTPACTGNQGHLAGQGGWAGHHGTGHRGTGVCGADRMA